MPLSKKTTTRRTPAKEKVTPPSLNFPIVGLGASAGGLEAVIQFLKRLPSDTGVAVVVIQHLNPKHESFTSEILGRATAMPVLEAQDGMRLQPDRVYVIPPKFYLSLSGGTLKLSPRTAILGLYLPINFFFSSMAEQLSDHAIGVVLSGTASDGTQGLTAIKAEGGISFAQEPQSAKYPGMPQSAILAGAVDFVLTPEGIADEISRIAHSSYLVANVAAPEEQNKNEASETTLNKIFKILRNRVQVDFTHYKRSTILRRLARRMLVIKSKDLESYADYLEGHPDESKALFADILIHVTEFFRDGDAFDSLKKSVLEKYIEKRDPKASFRVWVAGCSTGEEAYSLAMLLLDFLEETSSPISLQVFASDLSENALQKARTGLYGEFISGVSKTRLEKYFDKVSGGYRVKKVVRDTCVFSNHDLTRDPPFAKVDLISCRNVLIYFDDELQKRVFPIFHYSLNPGGILILGKAENIGSFANLFSTVDKVHKVFLKKDVKTPIKSYAPSLRVTPFEATESRGLSLGHAATYTPNQSEIQKELDRIALRDYSPPSIVINDSMDILQVRGRTTPYLELAPGQASLNLLKMARPELISDLRKLIKAARTKDRPVKKEGFSILDISGFLTFNIKVTPLKPSLKSGDRCYAIFFEVLPHPGKALAIPRKTKGANLKERHLLELQQSKANEERLQDLNEEYETSQEELTAANEELQSANEELQSTNEEMETAREELQSSNEELTTVNDELQTRNAEMIQLNDDLVNLVSSTEIPIAMVGADGRIRRFTAQAEKQFKIISGDVGRKLSDLRPDLGGLNLVEIVNEVITTSESKEIETQDSTGHWFQLNVKPYRNIEKKVDGAVMSLIDIHTTKTGLELAKLNERNLLAAREDAIKIIEANPVPLLVITSNRKVLLANKAFYLKFDPKAKATEGHTLAELGNGQWDIPALTSVIDKTLSEGIEFEDFEIKHVFPQIGLKVMALSARRVQLPGSGIETVLLAIEDYTEKRRNEEDLRASEEKYRNLVANAYDGIMVVRQDASIEFANRRIEVMFGYSTDELINKNYEILITDRDRPKHVGHHAEYLLDPHAREMGTGLNLFGKRKDGSEFPVDISLSPFKLKSETFVNCVVRDISSLKEIEKERSNILEREKEARAIAEKSNHEKDEFLAMISHELRTPLTSILTWSQMLRQGRLDTEKTQKAYAILEQSALAQAQLIDDLLDVSRIQAGKLNLNMQKIDPRKVIAAAIESTRSLAASKSIQIDTKIDPSVLHIFADPVRLQQILWNLLSNSIKFSTNDGKIWITLESKKISAGEYICIQVRDNGKGIKPEFIPIIFERFTQVDSTTTRAYGGLGLGLAILKKLVEMHHGTVEVDSPGEGKGATFTIYLPVASCEKMSFSEAEAEAEVEVEVSLHGLRVLLVEDDQNARHAFSLMLGSFGAEVKAVESASAALAIIEEFKPNVLVSDIAMPGEDGYSLIGKIRALESELRKIPALALTAYAGQSDIQQALLAGFQSHMAKPVDADELALAISRLVGKIK